MSRPDTHVASSDNADRGRRVEISSTERFPRVLVVEELTQLPIATPVEVKGCVDELETQPRSGRWWIRRDNHEDLLEAAGAYALAVYDEDGDVLRMALIPATWVDLMLEGRWTPCGDRVPGQDECAQLPWTALFDSLEEPDTAGGGAE